MEHLIRQADLIPKDVLGTQITIIGAGAIGSWVCLSLAKMGFGYIRVYDYDTVDIENMNCQFYRFDDIGKKKIDALRDMVYEFTKVTIMGIDDKYTNQKHGGIIISALDNMKARRDVFEAHKASLADYIIDPRMGGEFATMYIIDPADEKDRAHYEKTLHSDEEAVHERCTAKATMYTANLLGGLVAKAVKDIVTNAPYTRTVQWDIGKNEFMSFLSE